MALLCICVTLSCPRFVPSSPISSFSALRTYRHTHTQQQGRAGRRPQHSVSIGVDGLRTHTHACTHTHTHTHRTHSHTPACPSGHSDKSVSLRTLKHAHGPAGQP